MPKQYQYDPTETMSYEHYVCPTCDASFYSGGRAMHDPDCPVKGQGYDACTMVFGPKQVKEVIHMTEKYGEKLGQWHGLSIQVLREQFPELLPERLRTATTEAA